MRKRGPGHMHRLEVAEQKETTESLILWSLNHHVRWLPIIIVGWFKEAEMVRLFSIVKSSPRLHMGALYPQSTPWPSSWVCLFYWLCILKSLYWFWQIHLATQFSGRARLGSSTSSFFSVLCAISYSHTAPSIFPCFFSCSLTRFALCCCFLNSCSLALPPPACLIC